MPQHALLSRRPRISQTFFVIELVDLIASLIAYRRLRHLISFIVCHALIRRTATAIFVNCGVVVHSEFGNPEDVTAYRGIVMAQIVAHQSMIV